MDTSRKDGLQMNFTLETLSAFAAETLAGALETLGVRLEEMTGKKDPEFLHKARVATRRLRAATGLFSRCTPRSRVKGLDRCASALTVRLGKARDLDVQIEALREELKADRKSERAGLSRLVLRLEQKREKQERKILEKEEFREAGVFLRTMAAELRRRREKEEGKERKGCSLQDLSREILRRTDGVLGYAPCVTTPEASKELHDLRKMVKKLRYALELLDPLSGGRLGDFLPGLKNLQDSLGELHDCDVWIAFLPAFIEKEKGRTEKYYGHIRTFAPLAAGIIAFLERNKLERVKRHHEFLGEWNGLGEKDFWSRLSEEGSALALPVVPKGDRRE